MSTDAQVEALKEASFLIDEITDLEGREGLTDYEFAEQVIALAHAKRDQVRAALAAAQAAGPGAEYEPDLADWANSRAYGEGWAQAIEAAAQILDGEARLSIGTGSEFYLRGLAAAIRALRPPAFAEAASTKCSREAIEGGWNECHRCKSLWSASNVDFRPMGCPEYRPSASAPARAPSEGDVAERDLVRAPKDRRQHMLAALVERMRKRPSGHVYPLDAVERSLLLEALSTPRP